MYPIIAPITIGQSGSSVQNLQDVLLFLVQKGDIVLSNNFPLTNIHEERLQSFFGDATAACLKLFCEQHQLQSNPQELVNNAVAASLNSFLSQYPEGNQELISVSGIVSHTSGNLLPANYTIRLEQVLFNSNVSLGTTQMNSLGNYSFSVLTSALTNTGERYAFRAVVLVAQNEEYASKIEYIPLSQRSLSINVVLNTNIAINAEYTTVKTKVEALIGQTAIQNITLDGENPQSLYLVQNTNEGSKEINALVWAHQLSVQLSNLNPEFFYGIIRQNLPNIAEQLLFQTNKTIKSSIKISIENNIIQSYTEQQVDTFVNALKETIVTRWNANNASDLSKTITFRIYNAVLNNTALTNEFLSIFYNYEGDVQADTFWKHLEDAYQSFDTHLKKLKAVTVIAAIVGNNPALVASLLAILNGSAFSNNQTLPIVQGEPQPELLAGISLANWTDIITAAKQQDANNFLFPIYVEGQNDQQKIAFYAKRLLDNFTAIYTIYSIRAKIAANQSSPFPQLKSKLTTFLNKNIGFDIRAVSILALKATQNNPYDLTGIQNKPAFIEEIAIVQRLSALTSSYEAMAAMAEEGIVSAFHITRMGRAEFAESYESVLETPEKAFGVYDAADSITTHVIGKAYEVYGETAYEATPWTGLAEAGVPIGADPSALGEDPYAEWRVLFGPLDGCTCCHCESVYSPSAYLVDNLHFLKNKGGLAAHNKLVNVRRPDIKGIELTCDNANIPVPYIDIVNELLEDLISTGTMYPRQTKAAAEYQKAIPEHFNSAGYYHVDLGGATGTPIDSPYPKLKESSYPWTLPYNVYKRQIDTHLSIPGIKGFEMVQRFSNKDLTNSLDDLQFCTNYLNISNELRTIITTASSLTAGIYKDLQVHYGLTASYTPTSTFKDRIPDPAKRGYYISLVEATWITSITNRVDVFLQQTQLSYRDLLELLDCYYINPVETTTPSVSRKFAILNNDTTADIATCNLYELKIYPANVTDLPPFMDRVHRFVRLARALGWHFYELDRALRAIGGNEITSASFKKMAQLKYLAESLNIKVEDACTLFQDVEILPYRDYRHEDENCELIDIPNQYTRIFKNPVLANANLTNPFPAIAFPATAPFGFSVIEVDKFCNLIAGIIQFNPDDTATLLEEVYVKYSAAISTPGGKKSILPNINILSYIYRQATLIKALKLSMTEWTFYVQWLSKNNYFGNISADPANNTAAVPISMLASTASPYTAIPFDTLRFNATVRLFKNAGFKTADLEYLLLDKAADTIADDKLNAYLASILTDLRADLLKKWYPAFNPSSANASKELLSILSALIDEQDAKQLMNILDRVLESSPAYSSQEYDFINVKMIGLLSAGSADKLANTASGAYISSPSARYEYVYDQIKNYIKQSRLKPAILSALAKTFKLGEETVQILLNDVVSIAAVAGFDILLNADFVNSSYSITRWVNAADQFKVLLQVHKAALLISKFNLGSKDIQYLWVKKIVSTTTPVIEEIPLIAKLSIRSARDTVFVPGTSSETTFRLLRNLLQWMQIRAFTGADINILFKAIENNAAIVASMAAVFKLSTADINTLIIDAPTAGSTDKGCLNIDVPLYRNPISYLRIIDCLEMQYLMPAPMRTLYAVAAATRTADNQSHAAEVIHLVKAPYTDKQWLEVIKPISDLLRVERRDALIDYLLAYPVSAYKFHWLTSNDIYETLMVDVEMMPIMSTTRTLLAINTVQLWMDRVLLQLEAETVSNEVARQWTTWRKLYRVWEANRKVFLYPENWIEPELRDDKTPLFLELEKFLKQNEVTKDNVEQAYKTYLERLDQLSRLDIIGIYRETDQAYQDDMPNANNVVHAFGRTKEHPHLYHYRRRVAGVWSPWEKMDVQIEGDHFIPVMWRGRLRFYWLVFTKDQEEVPMSSIQSEGSQEMPAGVRWKIELAWTELKDGKWIGKQLSKEAVYSRFIYEEMPINNNHASYYAKGDKYSYKNRSWNEAKDLEKIKKESIIFLCNPNSDGSPSFSVIERDYGISANSLDQKIIETYDLLVKAYGTKAIRFWSDEMKAKISKLSFERLKTWLDSDFEWVTATYDRYWTHLGQFIVKFNGVSLQANPDSGAVIPSLYIDYAATPAAAKRDLQSNRAGYWPANTDYLYSRPHHLGYAHFPDGNVKLLDGGPGHYFNEEPLSVSFPEYSIGKTWVLRNRYQAKYLVFPRKVPDNFVENTPIQIPYFFYKDNKNTFFVEKVSLFYKGFEIASGPMGPTPMFGEVAAKVDAKTGTGISLGSGIASADYDLVHPEADVIPFGSEGTSMESIKGYYKAAYRFHNFVHERVDEFLEILHREGLDGLLKRDFISSIPDSMDFAGIYKPTVNVHGGVYYPHNKVDFSTEGAYSMYNWELFFHIPMLIANKLSQNQQFDEARNWYHYVFNPTAAEPVRAVSRFWNFGPFHDKASEIVTIDSIMKSASLSGAIDRWANDPFKPHLIARTRPSAYMKNTVMKYLDNLIAWADNKFRSDSREAINEATLLYILALQILGRKPETIPARAKPVVQTYDSMSSATGIYKLDDFGNAMVKVENILLSSGAERHYDKTIFYVGIPGSLTAVTKYKKIDIVGDMYYFCTPPNEKLLQYWEILADRLFKIRNSQSIDGVTRELALYDPPIDPAILVKAAASGVSLSGILGDLNAPLPSYRFNVISQKASELVNEVKSLGGQLLSALEKKDAEQISLLRSSQEIKVLEAITDLKEKAIQESKTQWEVLKVQLKSTKQRQGHYKNLIDGGLIGKEQLQISNMQETIPLQLAQGIIQAVGGVVGAIPNVYSTPPGTSVSGVQLAAPINASASVIGIKVNDLNIKGSMAGINAGHERRKQDWELQYKLATIEVEQMNKQLIASEIRYAMAQVELRNHQIQMSNAQEMELAMREKYTNEQLYDWMTGQISFVYFQGYKLAYETAKKAERCFRYELNLDTSDYIQYGYWDSLKKGLLAGENLAYDLKRMEVAYLDKNKRQLELTKHISVAALNPEALMNLRNNKSCEIDIPEWLYDIDYPGQHMRRIKSVSISIPCVAGPYTTISCKLSLTKSKYRKSPFLASGGDYVEGASDNRFTYMFGNIQSIATSSAQNDSGMFEMNFRDERYLPFEGCGAISTWAIELPAAYAQFDYKTISDVIIHIKYTAIDGGSMKVKAKEAIDTLLAAAATPAQGLYRIFDLKHEFSNEWHLLLGQEGGRKMLLDKLKERLPYLVQNKTITIEEAKLFADKDFDVKLKKATATPTSWDGGSPAGTDLWKATLALTDTSINDDPYYLHFKSDTPITDMKECWLLIHYKLS